MGGELQVHGALNDMAAAVLDASLLALLGVVTVSDLRTRLVPDGALLASLLVAISVCVVTDPDGVPGSPAGRPLRRRLPAGGGADPARRHGAR